MLERIKYPGLKHSKPKQQLEKGRKIDYDDWVSEITDATASNAKIKSMRISEIVI